MERALAEIIDLTRRFLDGDISGPEFDDAYRDQFSRMPVLGEDMFLALENLAYACSQYVEDPALRDEPEDVDEEGLAEAAREALRALGQTE